jgi:pimeloyl-ACP methyl ester carboxylesterase
MARAHRDSELLQRIFRSGVIREEDLFRYGGEVRGAESYAPILMAGLWAPEYDLWDILNVPKGAAMVDRRMKDDLFTGPLEEALNQFEIPVYFFLGRHDYSTPSLLAEEYFESLQSPRKELVWFESSAHFPFWEEPGKFSMEMRRLKADLRDFWSNRSQ